MTCAEAIAGAAMVLAQARARRDALSPRKAAEAAWYSGHPMSVDEIEALIIRQRANAVARYEEPRAQASRTAPQ